MTAKSENELVIEILPIKRASLVLRAINHNLRRQMLQLLHVNIRMTVTQIYVKLRLEQSVASQHLAILRKVGLVHTEREGKFVFYSVNYDRLKKVQEKAGLLLNP